MDKKEIYEHLANIYLDASSKTKRKKKNKKYSSLLQNGLLFGVAIIVTLSLAQFTHPKNNLLQKSTEVALFLQNEAVKMNFNFDPAKKEVFSLKLNNLDLTKYKNLKFTIRKTSFSDTINMRVEFSNSFREKSAVYFKDIPSRWQECSVKLSDFKDINNWSQIQSLSFIIEEWNTRGKKGVVYIDNVKFFR